MGRLDGRVAVVTGAGRGIGAATAALFAAEGAEVVVNDRNGGSPGQAALTAAAGAVVGLTRTLARELGSFGINVNAVAPGFIETRLTAALGADDAVGVAEPVRQMTKAMTALGRYGTPEDVARAHLFLASADADFVTGITLPVTGGMLGTCV